MKTTKIVTISTLAIALSACGGPQVTAMQGPSGNTEYLVDCGQHGVTSGGWDQCYSEAAKACPGGYAIRDKNQEYGVLGGEGGMKRTLLVACRT
jgi:hypothetical protein